MPTHHEIPATPETMVLGYFDAALPPVLTVASGDTVTLHSHPAGGRESLHPDPARVPADLLHALDTLERGPGPHFVTGPVHVAGAEPGDMLQVDILDLKFRLDWGFVSILPLLGTLPDEFTEYETVHADIDTARSLCRLPWGTELPLDPFFGIMGTAPPAAWGRVGSPVPRAFGGNMDNKELVAGSAVYFPVFVPGALFSVGDGHALQGDGEVCLTAIEAALLGTFEFHLRSDLKLTSPRAETANDHITMGFDEDLDDAAKAALRDMITLIRERSGLSAQDAYTLCSIAADLRVTQLVDGNKGVHCVLAKSRMPGL